MGPADLAGPIALATGDALVRVIRQRQLLGFGFPTGIGRT
jgi:hypothetical protein